MAKTQDFQVQWTIGYGEKVFTYNNRMLVSAPNRLMPLVKQRPGYDW
jgi:hypothetical protein